MNAAFQKYFPTSPLIPILRNLETNRYWINEYLQNILDEIMIQSKIEFNYITDEIEE